MKRSPILDRLDATSAVVNAAHDAHVEEAMASVSGSAAASCSG